MTREAACRAKRHAGRLMLCRSRAEGDLAPLIDSTGFREPDGQHTV